MTTEIGDIPTFDITVKKESLEDDLFAIYSRLFKEKAITKDQLSFEELRGGYVNAIWKVTPKDKSRSSLVFRTFGMKFDQTEVAKKVADLSEKGEQSEEKEPDNQFFFSRLAEFGVMQAVSKQGLCQPIYAKYQNGLVYGYTEGHCVTTELMQTDDFLKEASKKLARFHSIKYEVPGMMFKTYLERCELQLAPGFRAMLKEIDTKLVQEGMPYPFNQMPRIHEQIEVEEKILSFLKEAGLGRTVLCHNDVNQKNMIWNPKTKCLGFIDFEVAMAQHHEFELGYLFCTFPGHFLYEWNREMFPNEDYRRLFLRKYLEEFYTLNGLDASSEEFETELEDLFHKVNLIVVLTFSKWVGLGTFFDFNPQMFQNEEIAKQREMDKYFCSKFSLKIYRLFQELYGPFFEDAKRHFSKRKQDSS